MTAHNPPPPKAQHVRDLLRQLRQRTADLDAEVAGLAVVDEHWLAALGGSAQASLARLSDEHRADLVRRIRAGTPVVHERFVAWTRRPGERWRAISGEVSESEAWARLLAAEGTDKIVLPAGKAPDRRSR